MHPLTVPGAALPCGLQNNVKLIKIIIYAKITKKYTYIGISLAGGTFLLSEPFEKKKLLIK